MFNILNGTINISCLFTQVTRPTLPSLASCSGQKPTSAMLKTPACLWRSLRCRPSLCFQRQVVLGVERRLEGLGVFPPPWRSPAWVLPGWGEYLPSGPLAPCGPHPAAQPEVCHSPTDRTPRSPGSRAPEARSRVGTVKLLGSSEPQNQDWNPGSPSQLCDLGTFIPLLLDFLICRTGMVTGMFLVMSTKGVMDIKAPWKW